MNPSRETESKATEPNLGPDVEKDTTASTDNAPDKSSASADNASDVSDNSSNASYVGDHGHAAGSVVGAGVTSQNPYCPAVNGSVTKDECDLYTSAIGHLETGEGVFNPPNQMKQAESRLVEFAVSNDPTEPASEEVGGPGGNKITLPIKISQVMAATLSGEGFDIKPMSSDIHPLAASGVSHWSWIITALPSTEHALTLAVSVKIPGASIDQQDVWARSRTYKVKVNVTPTQWWNATSASAIDWISNTQHIVEALTALAAAVGALWLAMRAIGRRKRAKSR